jgi:hypothetical protein
MVFPVPEAAAILQQDFFSSAIFKPSLFTQKGGRTAGLLPACSSVIPTAAGESQATAYQNPSPIPP